MLARTWLLRTLQSTRLRQRPCESGQTECSSFLFSEYIEREVVSGTDLDAVVVISPAVADVFPSAPLEFRARHQVLDRVIHEIENAVVATLERIGGLQDGVADIDHRVSDRCTELLGPGMVEECDYPDHRKLLACEGPGWVAEVHLSGHIHRGIVHVVLNPFAEHAL